MSVAAWREPEPQGPVKEWIKVGMLSVDTRVQRSKVNQARVNKIVREFRHLGLGVIHVSHRADGTIHIIDGAHRVAATVKVEGSDYLLDCKAYHGLTRRQEADMFELLNDSRRILPLDTFRVQVERGDKDAVEIRDILQRRGVLLGSHLKAIEAVRRVYRGVNVPPSLHLEECYPDAVDAMLEVVIRAWGTPRGNSVAFNGHVLEGIGSVFAVYPHANRQRLARRLAQQGDAAAFYSAMKARVEGTHNGLWREGAFLAIKHLNSRLQSNRLVNPWLTEE